MSGLTPEDPREIGGYTVLDRLGEGGMGVVFLARSPAGVPTALKVIQPALAEASDFRTRFEREVALARRVQGSFTAHVLGADSTGPIPWLATELIRGQGLDQVVRENGPLPEKSLRALAIGMVEALREIHGAGLIHRDLKPSNVLVTADGPRVIDFGVARAVDGTALTVTGQVVGTPGYLAPELVRGRPVAASADLFALGGVLAYAATGRQPFGTGPPVTVLFRVVSEEPDLDGVPEGLLSLVNRCLAKEPDQRPSPADLRAELFGEGGETGGEFPRRNWIPAAVAAELDKLQPLPPPAADGSAPEVPASVSAPASVTSPVGPRRAGRSPHGPAGAAPAGEVTAGTRTPRQRTRAGLLVFAGIVALTILVATAIRLQGPSTDQSAAVAGAGQEGVSPQEAASSEAPSGDGDRVSERVEGCPALGPDQAYSLSLAPDGDSVLALTGFGLSVFEVDEGVEAQRLRSLVCGDTDRVRTMAASRDGSTVALSDHRDLSVWSPVERTGRTVLSLGDLYTDLSRSVDPHPQSIALSGDGRVVAAVGVSDELWLRQTDGGARMEPPETGDIAAVALDAAGSRVVVQGRDGVLSVWDVESGERERELGSPEGPVSGGVREMVLTEGGTLFHAGLDAITVWDVDRGRQIGGIALPGQGPATGLWVSPDGDGVAASTDDWATFTVWNAESGAVEWSAPEGTLHGAAVPVADGGALGFVPAGTDTRSGLALARISEDGEVTPLTWR